MDDDEEITFYLCDSDRMIKDGVCNGLGCRVFNECWLTTKEEYALLPNGLRMSDVIKEGITDDE